MRWSFLRHGIVCAVFLMFTGAARAAATDSHDRNWPQWRGPDGDGLVLQGDPPLEWSEEKNVKWKVRIPGRGHATPVIWNDQVFVLTAVPSRQAAPPLAEQENPEPRRERGGRQRGGGQPEVEHAFTTLSLDRRTGNVLWEQVARRETPHGRIQPSNSHSSGSPVTDGERVYVSFGSHGLYCYDTQGTLLWEHDLGKVDVTFGEGSSPALAGDSLLVVQDNNGQSILYAFDKKTGRERWKQRREEGSGWTTPFIIEDDGRTLAIINGSRAVRAYDAATGELVWECSGLGSNPVPMVVADASAVYAMSGHRSPTAIAIKLGGKGDLTGTDAVLWTVNRGTPYVPSPLLYDGLIFFCQRNDPIVTCLDAATGEPHYSQERLDGISGVYASPIGVKDRIYLAGQDGATLVLAKGKELKVLARNRLNDGFDASPAVVGNELFLRGRENLYCIAAD